MTEIIERCYIIVEKDDENDVETIVEIHADKAAGEEAARQMRMFAADAELVQYQYYIRSSFLVTPVDHKMLPVQLAERIAQNMANPERMVESKSRRPRVVNDNPQA